MDEQQFIAVVLRNPVNRVLLERWLDLALPQAWLVAGCLCQTLWNVTSGLPPEAGIRDYDIFYFDGADLSWESEDRDIRRASDLFQDIDARIEIRNQARVHLWYGARFGPGYPQLTTVQDGIDRFLTRCTRVAIRGTPRGIELYAPDGLGDLCAGILRPNPLNDRPDLFRAKSESYRARWPWLVYGT